MRSVPSIALILCFGFSSQAFSEQLEDPIPELVITETMDGGPDMVGPLCALFARGLALNPNYQDDAEYYDILALGFSQVAVERGQISNEAMDAILSDTNPIFVEEVWDLSMADAVRNWNSCLDAASRYPETKDLVK
ncbi:hypothetical protein [Ascidiaceihabitans sp.]|uniref:hypothetical protein n=1 Tax=Ascidiaceihabitans sp. TaxID=1872644 RepID=UPI003298C462